MTRVQLLVFRLCEQRQLRNWFYIAAFAIIVPAGYLFAGLAWRYGSWRYVIWYDKLVAVIAGLFIGIATVVTLFRIWHVPPKKVVTPAAAMPVTPPEYSLADELMAATRRRAAQNRDLASHAAALGSSMGKTWH
jgi:hypothetical protein